MLPQCLEALDIKPDGIYVDATFGGGGHSRAIVERLAAGGHLYSFDQDEDAVRRAFSDDRFTMVYGNFRYLTNFLRYYGVDRVDGILADLGVSFHHFDDGERGFSFRSEGPLDMRMNRRARLTAAEIVNTYDEKQLADIFYLYGELERVAPHSLGHHRRQSQGPGRYNRAPARTVRPLVNPRKEKNELARLSRPCASKSTVSLTLSAVF